MRKHGSVSFAYSYLSHNVENKTKEQKDVLIVLSILNNELFNHNDGQLYKVNIPEDDTMLLWDKPLSEQTDSVKEKLEKKFSLESFNQDYETAADFYKSRVRKFNNDKMASEELNELGITGIKYLDGSSRFAGDGSYNYVVFDDNTVEILKTYYSAQQDGTIEGFTLTVQSILLLTT